MARKSKKRDLRTAVYFRVGEDEAGYELYERINHYRKLSGMSWRTFILYGIGERVIDDDPMLAQAIVDYLTDKY